MSPRIPIIHSIAIYGGGHHLGDVAELATTGQYAAFDPTGRRLGVFDDRADAERAAWNNTVVPCQQPSITIYVNPHGAAIIRQEKARDMDRDTYIVIQPQNARAVAAAILRAAGIEDPIPGQILSAPPAKNSGSDERGHAAGPLGAHLDILPKDANS